MLIKIISEHTVRYCHFSFKDEEYGNDDCILLMVSSILRARRKTWKVTLVPNSLESMQVRDELKALGTDFSYVTASHTLSEVCQWASTIRMQYVLEDE